ncbi:MAG: phage holin family protein [Sulfitobacter sp.]|nr:phage holin family protein [Sulfitobacter sp.]
MTDPERKPSTELVNEALRSVSSLVRQEVDLARAEIDQNVTRAAAAIGLLVGAVVVALVALNVLAGALVAALAEAGIAPGWAAIIVGVILGLIAFGMMTKGTNDLKLSSLAPSRTMKNVKRDAQAVKETTNA